MKLVTLLTILGLMFAGTSALAGAGCPDNSDLNKDNYSGQVASILNDTGSSTTSGQGTSIN